jgi:hypothetical protein
LKVVALAFNANAERWQSDTNPTGVGVPINFIDTFVKQGETLRLNKGNGIYDYYFVAGSTLETRGAQMSGSLLPGVVVNMLELLPINISTFGFGRTTCQYVYDASSQGAYNPEYAESNDVATNVYMIHCQGTFQNSYCYGSPYYGNDTINITTNGIITGFDAIKIIEAIAINAWSDVVISNLSTYSTFPINPFLYFQQLLFEDPFDMHPLDAVKFLADSLGCYIFFNKQGQLVLKNKSTISTGTVRTLPDVYKNDGNKKYFWDKIIDSVTVNVQTSKTGILKSITAITKETQAQFTIPGHGYTAGNPLMIFGDTTTEWQSLLENQNLSVVIVDQNTIKLTSNGSFINSTGMTTDYITESLSTLFDDGITPLTWTKSISIYPGIKPRNEIQLQVLAPSNLSFTQAALDNYALTIAQNVFNFYGLRHFYYNIKVRLNDDMLDWELLDLVYISGEYYFILSSEIDEVATTATFELVSVNSYDYNYQQAQIVLSPAIYAASIGSAPSTVQTVTQVVSSGGGTISISAQLPLLLTGSVLSINYSTNLKITNNNLDTIQGIKTTDTPQFAKIGIGGIADTSFNIKNYGDEWIVGNQKVDGVVSIGGIADTNYKLKVYGNQRITGDLTIDGNFYVTGAINEVNQTNLNIVDHTINLNNSGDNTTALNGGIQMLGASNAVIASIIYNGSAWLSSLPLDLLAGNVYKINTIEVLNSTTLGAGIINSSLTKVGTISTGVWQGTIIDGTYINYNTTNFQVSSNKLNTIQNISLTSSPQFANATLTGQLTCNIAIGTAPLIITSNTLVANLNADKVDNFDFDQSVKTTNSPTFVQLTSSATFGTAPFIIMSTTKVANLNADKVDGYDFDQSLKTTDSPTFSNLIITNNFSTSLVNSSLIPISTDTYDLGSSTKLWRKGWLSEMEAILFAKNTITLLGGWFYVTKNAGTLPSDVNNTQTQIDLGTTLNYGDYIIFRQPLVVEYMIVGSNVSGTTYNVGRDLDGTGANAWAAGTPFAVFGQNGDGRIELNAYDTPRISLIKQGITYNSQTEIIRIGDLNGMPTYSTQKWGIYIGDSTQYLKYDKDTGALVIAGNGNALDISSNTTVSTINSTLTTYGTSITANANAIALKASQSDLNTLSGRVTTAEASIVINANAIALKASQTSLDTLTGRVTTAESNITVNANNIALKVSTTDYTGATIASKLNLTSHSIDMSALNIDLTGIVTFSSFDTTTANTINGKTNSSDVTTIIGNTVTTSYLNAKSITALGAVTAGTFSLGSGAFSVDANGKLTSTSAAIASWAINATSISNTFTYGTTQQIVNLYGALVGSPAVTSGLQIISNLYNPSTFTSTNQLLITVGSYNDAGAMRSGISIWDCVNNGWLMNVGSSAGVNTIALAGFNFTKDYFCDIAAKIYISSINKSIYIRPLTGLTKFVMVGQTYYGGTYASPTTAVWTGSYGISAIDNSNRWMFILDDQYTMIAGWTFDYQKFTVGTSAMGMSLNTSSTPFIANSGTGFEVWNVSSPKMMLGTKNSTGTALTAGYDWNMTTTNKLTVVGDMIGSNFSTISSLDTTKVGTWSMMKAGNIWASYYNNSIQYLTMIAGAALTLSNLSNNNNIQINSAGSAGSWMSMDGYYVPKYLGVINSPAMSLNPGDFRFNTAGKFLVYNGSAWQQIN